jgi:hypothetical protein
MNIVKCKLLYIQQHHKILQLGQVINFCHNKTSHFPIGVLISDGMGDIMYVNIAFGSERLLYTR